MQDYVTFGGALAFLLGILAVGMSGNRGMRFRSLIFLFGVAFILAGTGAEVSALLASHGSSAATAQSSDWKSVVDELQAVAQEALTPDAGIKPPRKPGPMRDIPRR